MSELVECLQIAHLEGYEYEAQKAEAYVRDLEEDLVRLRLIVAKMLGEMENALSEFSDSAGADFFDPFYDVMVLARNILAEPFGGFATEEAAQAAANAHHRTQVLSTFDLPMNRDGK